MPLVIIGAGGHAGEVFEVVRGSAQLRRTHVFAGFIVPGELREVLGHPVLGDDAMLEEGGYDYLIGINSSDLRARLGVLFQHWDLSAAVAIHDDSTIGPAVDLNEGVVVHAGGRIGLRSVLDRHVYVGCNAVVGHDCTVGPNTSILPGAVVSGHVQLAGGVQMGAGAVVLQGITVGENATIGAGSVVTKDVGPGSVVIGIPARPAMQPPSE